MLVITWQVSVKTIASCIGLVKVSSIMEIFGIDLVSVSYSIGAFIGIISVIVFIHEYGHYGVAKLCGVKVEAFSIGFGPEITGWNDRSGTRWKICMLPLGGYVKMFGDAGASSNPDDEKLKEMTEEEKQVSFHYKPLSRKAAIVAAGPLANYILAIIIFAFFFSYYGKPITSNEIGNVVPDGAAAIAGIAPGDRIVALGGTAVDDFNDIKQIVSMNPERTMNVTYERSGERFTTEVTPTLNIITDRFGNEIKVGILGIQSGPTEYKHFPVGESLVEATSETLRFSKLMLVVVGEMITGKRSAEELGGPIRIAKFSGQSAQDGWKSVLWFMAILSINLGLINLFPIPVLDGGHLLYYAIEAVKGEPLAEKFQEYGFKAGMAVIIALVVFTTVNDIINW